MLSISQNQIHNLRMLRKQGFVTDSVEFLRRKRPDWAVNKHDVEIESFLQALLAIADDHGIVTHIHQRKLMLLHIDHDPAFDDFLGMILKRAGVSEAGRIRDYAEALTRPTRPKRVTLDDL